MEIPVWMYFWPCFAWFLQGVYCSFGRSVMWVDEGRGHFLLSRRPTACHLSYGLLGYSGIYKGEVAGLLDLLPTSLHRWFTYFKAVGLWGSSFVRWSLIGLSVRGLAPSKPLNPFPSCCVRYNSWHSPLFTCLFPTITRS